MGSRMISFEIRLQFSLHDIVWNLSNSNLFLPKGSDSISILQTLTFKHNIYKRREKENQFPNFSLRWKAKQGVLYNFEGTNKVWNYSEVKKMNQMEIPYILTNKTLFCLYGVKLNGACVSLMKWDNLKRAGFLFE